MRKALFHGCAVASFTPCSSIINRCAMDNVHTFEGLHYIPINVIRGDERKWVSVGWLSKQMANSPRAPPLPPFPPVW